MASTPNPPRGANNPGRIGLIAVSLVVLAVVATAVVTTLRPPQDLDPATPEGVVQRFFQAIEERDFQQAHDLLGPDLTERCSLAELAGERSEYDRVAISEVVAEGSAVVVWVEVRRIDVSDPLNPYTYDETMEFELERSGESLVITKLPWPFYCGGKG